jgi:hypothetical protein
MERERRREREKEKEEEICTVLMLCCPLQAGHVRNYKQVEEEGVMYPRLENRR